MKVSRNERNHDSFSRFRHECAKSDALLYIILYLLYKTSFILNFPIFLFSYISKAPF